MHLPVVGGLLSAHLLSKKAGVEVEVGWPCSGPLLRLAEEAARKLLPGEDLSVLCCCTVVPEVHWKKMALLDLGARRAVLHSLSSKEVNFLCLQESILCCELTSCPHVCQLLYVLNAAIC